MTRQHPRCISDPSKTAEGQHGAPVSRARLEGLPVKPVVVTARRKHDGGDIREPGAGETDERLATVAAWRESPFFTDAERAALALAEATTRLSDRTDPVPDDVWEEAARHYDEKGLAAIILMIVTINIYNRLNVSTRQVAGAWG